jgi:hypothetical protein
VPLFAQCDALRGSEVNAGFALSLFFPFLEMIEIFCRFLHLNLSHWNQTESFHA